MIRLKKILIFILVVTVILAGTGIAIDRYVYWQGTHPSVLTEPSVAIVLGTYVLPDGTPCEMLRDRLETALELYREQKIRKILVTGDHGQKNYDEVNAMRRYLEAKGVPTEDIFMDHAGFSTYESMYRAKAIFLVEEAYIVTQNFHLPRAVYLARAVGIKSFPVSADKHVYFASDYYNLREVGARLKAFLQASVLHSKPTYLGEVIPIFGSGVITHDL